LYAAKRIDGSMRQAPFTIYIWGESGVGKSTVAQVVMADCLRAAGANPDPKFTAII
jgi:adenylylsulfate kinase-like enzyme